MGNWNFMNSETRLCSTLRGFTRCYSASAATVRNTGVNPFSFWEVHWVLLRPIRRTKQWLSVLLKDTFVVTWGFESTIWWPEKPEFEFGVLYRSATKLPRNRDNNWVFMGGGAIDPTTWILLHNHVEGRTVRNWISITSWDITRTH